MDWLTGILSILPGPMRDQIQGYTVSILRAIPTIIAAIVFVLILWAFISILQRMLPRALVRTGMRRALREVIVMLLTVGLWIAGSLIAITIAFPTIAPGDALAALGVGGVAIGFAFRDVFENFLAGLLLLVREPFSKSDFIECEGIDGQVEEITIRDTHVRQTDGQLVVAPNGMFFKNPVTIRTSRGLRRTEIIVGVAYDEDVDAARDVIEAAVKKVDSVRDDVRDVQVFANAFGASSIDFQVTWWTGSTPLDIRKSRDSVVAGVKRALDEAGIEIPFPYTTLTFKEPLPIRDMRPQKEAAE